MHTLPRITPLMMLSTRTAHAGQPLRQVAWPAAHPPRARHAYDIPDFKSGSMCLNAVRAAQAALRCVRTKRGGALPTALNSRHFFHEVQLIRIVLDAFGRTAVLGE
ncbi:MAG: hypothetical protein Q8R61_01045 [Thiobacillus sp.]|uniref:hypothetical protein n=1 Tax=Thiobacillus sp. TaxID=924 RepID=UPI00273542CC|nr:hypothetical protein [Thiobacillus sp.]MDP3421771.1 hypothetical protein [Thiobacillus sp.]MDP3583682.1 hypothetical protein [Thiobacillus sp.]